MGPQTSRGLGFYKNSRKMAAIDWISVFIRAGTMHKLRREGEMSFSKASPSRKIHAYLIQQNTALDNQLAELLNERYQVFADSDPEALARSMAQNVRSGNNEPGHFLVVDGSIPDAKYWEKLLPGRRGDGCLGRILLTEFLSMEEMFLADQLGLKIFFKPFSVDKLMQWFQVREHKLRN